MVDCAAILRLRRLAGCVLHWADGFHPARRLHLVLQKGDTGVHTPCSVEHLLVLHFDPTFFYLPQAALTFTTSPTVFFFYPSFCIFVNINLDEARGTAGMR